MLSRTESVDTSEGGILVRLSASRLYD